MTACSRRVRAEDGTTLVELLVTVMIIGIAFTAIVGGMTTSIFASDVHRQQASAETIMRRYAEAIKANSTTPYVDCASTYSFTAPVGFTASISTIAYGSADSMSFQSSCPPDRGLQRISLRVDATSGRDSETLDIVKRR